MYQYFHTDLFDAIKIWFIYGYGSIKIIPEGQDSTNVLFLAFHFSVASPGLIMSRNCLFRVLEPMSHIERAFQTEVCTT